jgi:hypothetical protein
LQKDKQRRPEEHVYRWSGFKAETKPVIVHLSQMVQLFSNEFFKTPLDLDHASRMKDYERELFKMLKEIGKTRAFWSP